MSVSAEIRRTEAIFWKDLLAERRTKASTNAVLFFAVLVLLLFGFALGPDAETLRNAAVGVIWLTVLFSSVLAFNRSFESETEGGTLETLLLYPGDRRSIFVGKLAANFVFVLLVEAVVVPLAAILYHLPVLHLLPKLALVIVLGTFGLVSLGTFYAAMASRVRSREVLLPLLLFPMLVPLLLASVGAARAVLAGDPMGDGGAWLRLLAAFDLVFFVAALMAFNPIMED